MKKKNRPYIFIILIIIVIIIIISSIIAYPIIKNNNYQKKLLKNIYAHTNLKDITYLNKENNYYIVKTKSKIYVLDNTYQEVLSLNIDNIKEDNRDIVYRRGSLYYEEKIVKDGLIKYNYYNINDGEFAYTISPGGD